MFYRGDAGKGSTIRSIRSSVISCPGDPTYITSHNNARSLIMKIERDELVEEVLKGLCEETSLGIEVIR